MLKVEELIQEQRDYFNSDQTKDVEFRLKQLKRLKAVILDYREDILEALQKDLKKAEFESYMTEVVMVIDEINFTIKHLKSWAKPRRVRTPLLHFWSSSYIHTDPYGVTLIISPWNYPFQLTLAPLIGAIAAGNCIVIKPSEYSTYTSEVIAELIQENFSQEYIAVVNGGVEVSKALLAERFDYIFFTGSVQVGKIVMKAAANYLTPITLELGGKSPCIVDSEVNIDLAAKRIVWGKFINCGQTCIAPDYLLVHQDIKEVLLNRIKEYIIEFYGKNPIKSKDYPRIINQKQFDRLIELLDQGQIIIGGEKDQKELYIAPTIIDQITWRDKIMEEEIFGPLLPVLEYQDLDQVISQVKQQEKPLALYFFSTNKFNHDRVLKELSFGGGCINETIMHVANYHLPFGGVGNSGLGSYHGKYSFDTFSQQKGIIKKSFLFDFNFRYPPYNDKVKWIKRIFRN